VLRNSINLLDYYNLMVINKNTLTSLTVQH